MSIIQISAWQDGSRSSTKIMGMFRIQLAQKPVSKVRGNTAHHFKFFGTTIKFYQNLLLASYATHTGRQPKTSNSHSVLQDAISETQSLPKQVSSHLTREITTSFCPKSIPSVPNEKQSRVGNQRRGTDRSQWQALSPPRSWLPRAPSDAKLTVWAVDTDRPPWRWICRKDAKTILLVQKPNNSPLKYLE